MSDIKDKLESLLAKRGVMRGSDWRTRFEALAAQRTRGDFEIDKFVPGEVVTNEAGSFYLVRHGFPPETRHGDIVLGKALEAAAEHIALSGCDAELDEFDPATAVFIDTETTGLAGGTGTVPFLVGVGYFDGDIFRLDQCFMRDFDEEEAMLRYLDPLFARFETLVTYNGKSFDIPLLQTRFIANRIPFRLGAAAHFDLLHAARRFWKRRLRDCSLGSIERSILGVQRHGDVPSAEIPEIWFQYVRSRDAAKLDRVFSHHKMDVLSLVTLTAWLSETLDAPHGQGFSHMEDRLSLVRLHFRQRRYEDVVKAGTLVLEGESEGAVRRECLELIAAAHKRQHTWEELERACLTLLGEFPADLVARAELAKLYEHRMRNLPEAERVCREAMAYLDTRNALGRETDYDALHRAGFSYRLERIRRKLSRGERGDATTDEAMECGADFEDSEEQDT